MGVRGLGGVLGGVWGGVPEGKTLPEGGLGGSGTRVSVGGGKMVKNVSWGGLKATFNDSSVLYSKQI